jgi:tetratricopeptide (TPR) repeat protein
MAEVADLSAEALPLARADGDTWATVFALFPQALAAVEQGNHDSAATFAAAACEAAQANEELKAGPLLVLGNLALLNGELDRAQQLFDRSNDLNRRAGEIWGLGIGLLIAAGLRIVRQDFESARAHAIEALSFNQELEDPRGIAWTIETLAGLLAVRGDHDDAARLWRPRTGFWRTPVCRPRRSSDGFAIVIRKVWKRHSGPSSCRPRWPRDARCLPRRRSRSRATTSWRFARISYQLSAVGCRLSAVGYLRFAIRFSRESFTSPPARGGSAR